MLKNLMAWLSPKETTDARSGEERILVAACSLFVEMARIDGEFSAEERAAILEVMRSTYDLDEALAGEIMAAAEEEVAKAVDVWRFTKQIRDHWSKDEQGKVVELLWRILFVDGHMDTHETYLINKVGELLHLSGPELVAIKSRVLQERGAQAKD